MTGVGEGVPDAGRDVGAAGDSHGRDRLRRAIVHAGSDLADLETALACARQLQDAGVDAAARLFLLSTFVRSGASPRMRRRQAQGAQAIGMALDLGATVGGDDPEPGSTLEVAVQTLRDVIACDAVQGAGRAPDIRRPPPSSPPADPAEAAALVAPMEQLHAALQQEPSEHAARSIVEALQALDTVALGHTAYPLNEPDLPIETLGWRLAFNAARAALLAVHDFGAAPLGSPAVLHRLAQADEAGAGPYACDIHTLAADGRSLLGLVQLVRGRALDGAGEREAFGRWAYLLSRPTPAALRTEVVKALADLALQTPLWAVLWEAERRPELPLDRGLLQAARDGAMDLGERELAWRLQERLAAGWPSEKGEWMALGDLAAIAGEWARSEAAFEEALRLDPGETYPADALADARDGRRERFGPRPGFGTPEMQQRLRAERAAGRWREVPDFTPEIKALQRAAARQQLVPEVAPAEPARRPPAPHDGLHLRRLGVMSRTSWGEMRVLRGVEAVRGFYVADRPMREVVVRLGRRTLARGAPVVHDLADGEGRRFKSVFNVWLDVAALAPGRHEVEISLADEDGQRSTNREVVVVEPARREADYPTSDAVVDAPAEPGVDLDAVINARPTQQRPARRRYFEAPPERVLVVRVDQLGDLVCSVPALQRLRALLPKSRITGLVSPSNAALARTLGLFDEVLTAAFDVDPVERRRVMPLASQAELRKALHARDFDLAIDLADNSPSRFLLLLSGAKRLCGVEGERYGFLDLPFQAHGVDPANGSEALPATNKMVALVEWLGCALQDYGTTLRRADLDPALLQRFKVEPRRFAVLHTGARLAFSRWPHYPALARRLIEETELTVVLLADGLPAGARLPLELTAHPRFRLVEHTVGFDELDALVSSCAVFVGNDSGPKHLASLRGAEVVSLHCARNNWNEWGQENRGVILSRRVPCAGCQISDHPEECGREIACLQLISPDEVLAATLGRLAASA